jgi:hypothetical protein
VKVGHRQASNSPKRLTSGWGVFFRRCKKSFKENAIACGVEGVPDFV